MKIKTFIGTGGDVTFRVEQSVHELEIERTSPLSILALGLVGAFPESVDMECTNQNRPRVQGAHSIPLHDIAAWAQFGKGPITEEIAFAGLSDVNFGTLRETAVSAQQVKTTVSYYLADRGPMAITPDDNLRLTLKNTVLGATYVVSVPEASVVAAYAQEFYSMERGIITEDTVSKPFFTAGWQGVVIPYMPDVITRVNLTYRMDESGATDEREYTLDELLRKQAQANPFVAIVDYTGASAAQRGSSVITSKRAGLVVIDFQAITKVELFTELGNEVRYTLFKVLDRNTLA